MGENSKIEWTDHTFNPWVGCQAVSPGCDHCYAEEMMDKRLHHTSWGPHAVRNRTSDNYWKQPKRWAKTARARGVRHKVFCASLADVFDKAVPDAWRNDLLDLIEDTPELDWLLLTKRPENIDRTFPGHWPNIWLGVSVEDQARADHRVPILLRTRAHKRFLSVEPLLECVNLTLRTYSAELHGWDTMIDWVIVGGESGPHARYMHPDWAREIHAQCQEHGVAFFMKQMAHKGAIPLDLQIREFPK